MRRSVLYSIIFLCLYASILSAQQVTLFGDNTIGEKGIASHLMPNGNVWVIGASNIGTNGNGDIVATCIDPMGNTVLGPFYYGSPALDYPNNMIYQDGKLIIAGETFDSTGVDGCILIIDTLGQLISFREYGLLNQSEQFFDIKKTADGGFIVAGFGAVPQGIHNDFLIAKFDANYTQEWLRIHDLGTNETGVSVIETTVGDYLMAGDQLQRGGNYNVALLLLDSVGNQKRTAVIANPYNGGCKQMKRIGNEVVIVGEMSTATSSAFDPYFIRTTLTGIPLAQVSVAQSDFGDAIFDIAIQNNNLYHMTGYLYDTVTQNTDLVILTCDSTGQILQKKLYGGNSFDMGYDIQLIGQQELLVTGFGGDQGDNQFLLIRDTIAPLTSIAPISNTPTVLQYFPNPTIQKIYLKGLSSPLDYQYRIYNTNGQPLTQGVLPYNAEIDCSHLSVGLYIIEIKNTTQNNKPPFFLPVVKIDH